MNQSWQGHLKLVYPRVRFSKTTQEIENERVFKSEIFIIADLVQAEYPHMKD